MNKPYDRFFRKEADKFARPLLKRFLGWEWTHSEPLRDKIQIPMDLETDFLLLLDRDVKELASVLHLEFQVGYQKILDHRMLAYYSNLLYRHKRRVKQAAIFLHEVKGPAPEWRQLQNDDNISFRYRALYLHKIPFRELLDLGVPEAATVAILGDFGELAPEEAIHEILDKLKEMYGNRPPASVVEDLSVLSSLRSCSDQLKKQLIHMPNLHNQLVRLGRSGKNVIINDIVEQERKLALKEGIEQGIEQGIEKGRAEQQRETIENLLLSQRWSPEEIAELLKVSPEFVRAVMEGLQKGTADPS